MDLPIGVIDSGLGGLSVVYEIKKLLPNESIIYFGDSINAPYSKRINSEIYMLSRKIIKFLIEKKVKLVVVACNTITVVALEKLRKEFPDILIIGTVPVVKTAASITANGKIGILSTVKTSKSKYQKELIKKFAKGVSVLNIGSDKIVPLIESGKTDELSQILNIELLPFKKAGIDVLALGCTHFPLIKDQISQTMGPTVQVIDSGAAIARQAERSVVNKKQYFKIPDKDVFYTTGNAKLMEKLIERLRLSGRIIEL